MAVFEKWLKNDLKKPVTVERLGGNIFSRDIGANRIGVIITDDGAEASITGDVTGYVIRADGETVIVSGTLDGNRASIILPAECYAIVGIISIVIKVGSTTVGACTGHVYQTSTDAIVDPGQVIPSVEELLEKISILNSEIGDAEAWAVGQRGGVDVGEDDPAYQNNAKYYAQKTAEDRASTSGASQAVQQYANAAARSAEQAAGSASAAGLAQEAAEKAEADVLAAIVAAQGNDLLRMDENGDFYILEETDD